MSNDNKERCFLCNCILILPSVKISDKSLCKKCKKRIIKAVKNNEYIIMEDEKNGNKCA